MLLSSENVVHFFLVLKDNCKSQEESHYCLRGLFFIPSPQLHIFLV